MAAGHSFKNEELMSNAPQYHPHEFFPTFEKLPKVGQVVICGGQPFALGCIPVGELESSEDRSQQT
jgi:hypothetical protein